MDTLVGLRQDYDVVICEGAGSPAEVNLRAADIANMGLARAADLPVLVVGDIDRGGVLAHLLGTLAVLSATDQALVAGFVINKFRGDQSLLEPGLDRLRALTEDLEPRLKSIWPSDRKDARRAYARLREAYIKARYSREFRITPEQLGWLGQRVTILKSVVETACQERLATLRAAA